MTHVLDPCRVYGAEGELLADGFVREQDEDGLLVEAANFTGRWLEPGDPAVVQVLSAVRGECTYDAVVASSEVRRIALTALRLRERVQKRSAVRVPTEVPVAVAEQVVDGRAEPLDPPVEAVVVDVSAYGLRLRTAAELDPGTRLVVPFAAARMPLRLVAEVLRGQETRHGFTYGCRLVAPSERDCDVLHGFVMQEQRRQLAARADR